MLVIVLPPVAALLALLISKPSAETAAAILLIAACPVGDIANAYALLARGSVARSLSLNEDTRSLVRSFLDVYPHASLWTTELHEMLLVGSLEPLELDVSRITERFNQPDVASALREVGIASPEALMATWITDRAGLETYAAGARPVTDDQPRIEYSDWVRKDELQRVLSELIGLRTDPPLRGADDAFVKSVTASRQNLLLFYQASLNGQSGYPELWARDIRTVLAREPGNAYYQWFGATRN